jgi:hypothetical protein
MTGNAGWYGRSSGETDSKTGNEGSPHLFDQRFG